MADIYGSHFEYAGTSSINYKLIIASVEIERFTQLSGTLEGVTIFNRRTSSRYLIDDDYSDFPLTFDIEIVTDDDSTLDKTQRRAIEKWLFGRHNYRKLYISAADDPDGETWEMVDGQLKRLYLNCRFVNPIKLEYNGGIVGYRATLEADSGLWWQDSITKSFPITQPESGVPLAEFTVTMDTDYDEYTYPNVTITMNSTGGDVILINDTDSGSRMTKFVGMGANATITLHGETNYVSGDYYSKFVARNFPRLLDGDNTFIVRGNVANVTFEYKNRRML